MDFSSFISSTFADGRINSSNLNAILQEFASKLNLEKLEFDPEKLLEQQQHENLRENFDIVNLSKRVEGVEEVTKQLLSTFESFKASNLCICKKLEETRVFANKIFDEVMKLKSSENCQVLKCEENDKTPLSQEWREEVKEISAKIEKLGEIMEQSWNNEKTRMLAISILDEKVENIIESSCKLKNVVDRTAERIKDLTFACEQLDGKSDEIDRDVQDFNARVCCVKNETKKIAQKTKIMCEKFENIQKELDFLDNEKASKTHVDELVDEKLKCFTKIDTFFEFQDCVTENVAVIDRDLKDMTQRTNIRLAKLQNQIIGKLNIDELSKFKENLQKNFNIFTIELENLLKQLLMNGQEGAGGKLKLSCVSCESEISMKTKTEGVPKLQTASNRFKIKMNKFPVRKYQGSSRSDILELLEAKGHDGRCFVISKDRSIFKADPFKCMHSLQYQKPENLSK